MTLRAVDIADYPTEVKQEVVDALERALERARRGEIQELVLVGVLEDEQYYFYWSRSLDNVKRAGLLEVAKYQVLRDWVAESVEE